MRQNIANIQSYSDIVTNSSSMIYIIEDPRSLNEIESILRKVHNGSFPPDEINDCNHNEYGSEKHNWWSGDGGNLDINHYSGNYDLMPTDSYEDQYIIQVDRCCYRTKEFIEDNFKIIDRESC